MMRYLSSIVSNEEILGPWMCCTYGAFKKVSSFSWFFFFFREELFTLFSLQLMVLIRIYQSNFNLCSCRMQVVQILTEFRLSWNFDFPPPPRKSSLVKNNRQFMSFSFENNSYRSLFRRNIFPWTSGLRTCFALFLNSLPSISLNLDN